MTEVDNFTINSVGGYAKLGYQDQESFGPADFKFQAYVNEPLAHGCTGFGGVLKRDSSGQWIAAPWQYAQEGIFGSPGKTREAAVRNCLPLAIKQAKELVIKNEAYAQEHDRKQAEKGRIFRIKEAGPDLLEALECLYAAYTTSMTQDERDTNSEAIVARAAIAKATAP